MTQSPGEPYTLNDPLAWLKESLGEEWDAKRLAKPTIELRSLAGNVRVQEGDLVLLYFPSPLERTPRGNRHRREVQPIAIDIRTYQRGTALLVRDEIVRILDRLFVRPDRYAEWDTLEIQNEAYPNDYADYTQIVLDVQLVKHLRGRPLPRALGG